MSRYDAKEDPNDYVTEKDTGKTKAFTKTPGVLDYVKEGFQSTDTRAQLNAIRNRRDKTKDAT